MQLPKSFLDSLEPVKGFDKEAFEKVHASGEQVTSIRINPLKEFQPLPSNFPVRPRHPGGQPPTSNLQPPTSPSDQVIRAGNLQLSPIPWTRYGYYLNERPSFTFDPLFHAGCYYVQEASSMFLEQTLKQTIDLSKPIKVLDLSASPGGKSTHIQSLISKDSLLVSNDVIRSRANILKNNIIKWGSENVVVTNNDPKDFVKLENYFDLIVVDAPCSGSGLFRREPEAIKEWSINNVALCSQRQQRILADVWPALKKGGIIIYSTCSYSREEDEDILDWMMKEFVPDGHRDGSLHPEAIGLTVDEYPGIVETRSNAGAFGYRFFPDKVKGEGFFIACFRKQDGRGNTLNKVKSRAEVVTKNEKAIIENWLIKAGHQFIKNENTVYAWPDTLVNDMNFILSNLRIIYSGVRAGDLVRDKLLPDHALAMSRMGGAAPRINLNYEQAIQYLQRKDIRVKTDNKGWQLVNYEGYSLGWINVLPGRINNYYPKELRILKDNNI